MGADGKRSLDHGAPAAVRAAVEVYRTGGYFQIADVGNRRKIDVHNGIRRNFLVNAAKQRFQILHGVKAGFFCRVCLMHKGQYLKDVF